MYTYLYKVPEGQTKTCELQIGCSQCREIYLIEFTVEQLNKYSQWIGKQGYIRELLPDIPKDVLCMLTMNICPDCFRKVLHTDHS